MTQAVLAQLKKHRDDATEVIYNFGGRGEALFIREAITERVITEKTINCLKTGYYLLDHELVKKINSAVKETTQPTNK